MSIVTYTCGRIKNVFTRRTLWNSSVLTSMPTTLVTPYISYNPQTSSRMTVFNPGQSPPQVTMAAFTSSDWKYTRCRGPARRKWVPLALVLWTTICSQSCHRISTKEDHYLVSNSLFAAEKKASPFAWRCRLGWRNTAWENTWWEERSALEHPCLDG